LSRPGRFSASVPALSASHPDCFRLVERGSCGGGTDRPTDALYKLLPSDLAAATAQSIATQLKLLLLVPGQQDHSVQLFADKVH
jgi:hypothetical protein